MCLLPTHAGIILCAELLMLMLCGKCVGLEQNLSSNAYA
jgi:hypothetical protein